MYEGYLVYGGNELVNNARVDAYMTNMGLGWTRCGPCGDLLRAIGQPDGYTLPEADQAPWWDPARPESARFAGVLGVRVDGLGDGISRQLFTDGADGRATLGPVRAGSREIVLTVELIAADEQALAYGRAWLTANLSARRCAPACAGVQLCGFTACPTGCPPPDDPDADDTCGDYLWRSVMEVGVISPPRQRAIREADTGAILAQYEIGLRAADPYLWCEPVPLTQGPAPGDLVGDYTDPGVEPDCDTAVDCVLDPLCPAPAAPLIPPPVRDLCYPTGPYTARRWVMDIPTATTATWLDKVSLIRINPGSIALRRVRLRWNHNPLGRPCTAGSVAQPCLSCAQLEIPYLPPDAWTTLDGRVRTASVACPGNPTPSPLPVYGPGGGPYTWPTFGCEIPGCLEITALAASAAPDLRWEISAVPREEAA